MTQGPFEPTHDPERARELGRELASGWQRTEFEAAVSLYVGGDLDAVESAAVESWLAAHPEDQSVLDAATAAREALISGSAVAGSTDDLDLWPSIRTQLLHEGWIGEGRDAAEGESLERAPAGRQEDGATEPRPVLAALEESRPTSGSWRPQFASAAAAALLFVGGLGWTLGLGSGDAGGGGARSSADDAFAVTTELRRSASEEHQERLARDQRERLAGVPSRVDAEGTLVHSERPLRLASSPVGGVEPLAPVGDDSPLLLESAIPLDLGAFGPVMHASGPYPTQGDVHSLASDGVQAPVSPLRIQLGEGRFLYFEVGGR